MFAALNRSKFLRSFSRPLNLIVFRKAFSGTIAADQNVIPNANAPKYSASRTRNLLSRIKPTRSDYDVVQVLEQWVAEGGKVHALELRRIIRNLRSRRRFSQALQSAFHSLFLFTPRAALFFDIMISEWISCNRAFTLSPGDCAVHLDLIGVVRGWEAAESYFSSLSDQDKNEKTYGALLNCYVREGLLTKTLLHMQRMKDIGYGSSTLAYNNLMALYKKAGQLEKIPETLSEMKRNDVALNNFSYRMCISSFGERSDLSGMEKLLNEMELRTDICNDWATYSIVAYHLIKANQKEKALTYMKKLEDNLDKDAVGYNHLISLYAHLGNKDEMMRLWVLQKKSAKYTSHWVLSEGSNRNIVNKGKKPTPNSWAIIAAGYSDNSNFEKAFECMKEALAAKECNVKWTPKPGLIAKLLNWIGDKGEIEEVEAFVWSLRAVVSVNRQMYHALIKASVRGGRDTGWILDRMRTDEIVVDDETQKMRLLNKSCNREFSFMPEREDLIHRYSSRKRTLFGIGNMWQEVQQERERQKEEQVDALKRLMQTGLVWRWTLKAFIRDSFDHKERAGRILCTKN
ncbi:hypothetical protein DH2020_033497 [Rehmannia glutinosa]|uniref:Pentatricopeptide repeat-containing protein n=1 Tax=Rehmannia glutinosa TaxID=99300 RepID=A0ABR0VEZ9_REHGL